MAQYGQVSTLWHQLLAFANNNNPVDLITFSVVVLVSILRPGI